MPGSGISTPGVLKKPFGRPRRSLEQQVAFLTAKRKELEKEIRQYRTSVIPFYQDVYDRFFQKKPDYYWSFCGSYIFKKWQLLNGLNPVHAELLVILSYYKYFLRRDHYYWNITWKVQRALDDLIQMGYVQKVKIPGRSHSKRDAFVLTVKGRDMEADYEKFYETKFEEFRLKKNGRRVVFDDGDYFRRRKKPLTESIRKLDPERKVGRRGNIQGLTTLERYNDQ